MRATSNLPSTIFFDLTSPFPAEAWTGCRSRKNQLGSSHGVLPPSSRNHDAEAFFAVRAPNFFGSLRRQAASILLAFPPSTFDLGSIGACLMLAHQTVCHSDQAPLAVSSLRHWAGMFQPASTCRVRSLQGLARHEGILLFRSLPPTIARLPTVASSIVCNIFRKIASPHGNDDLPDSLHTRSDWAVRAELRSGEPEQKLPKEIGRAHV